jgi:hypothetical protein
VELQMIPHKSLYHVSNGTTINAVFWIIWGFCFQASLLVWIVLEVMI